jgi:hypothetical protein
MGVEELWSGNFIHIRSSTTSFVKLYLIRRFCNTFVHYRCILITINIDNKLNKRLTWVCITHRFIIQWLFITWVVVSKILLLLGNPGYGKHFEITQVKHTTELISFQTQCNDSTFVDKLFKSVFKSGWCEKHVSKIYLKITIINYISFCFCWWNNYRNRIWPDFKIIFWKTC